jgi:class 3 adenylate cyclase
MPLGVFLIIYLLTLYLVAMLVLWHYHRGQKTASPLEPEVRFALNAGQTIVGVGDTAQGIDFYIGDYVTDEHYYDLN